MPYARRNGVRLHYAEEGTGPVVLLHTGGGGDGRMWEMAGYADALGPYRKLLLDHRGHGRSDCPGGLQDHRLVEYVNDVIAVLDAAGADRAALVGYSAGAQIAYAVSARHPDRVSAVVGIGTVGSPDDDGSASSEWAAEVRAHGMRAAMEELAVQEPEPAPAWLLDNLSETQPEMFALLLQAWAGELAGWADFPHVQAPTLVICGEDEEPEAARYARMAADVLPHGAAVILPGLWHLQAFWRTDLTLPPLVEFLRQHVGF